MEIDEFYPPNNEEEDYDMMIDDDDCIKSAKGTNESRWAKAPPRGRKSKSEPAYLDNDPTLVAPKKPPQDLSYSNSNHVPINKDASWTSIYSPR